jgi:hypothetical protein
MPLSRAGVVGARVGCSCALCLRLQRESSVRRWGVDGKGRGARGGGARVEGVDVASAPEGRAMIGLKTRMEAERERSEKAIKKGKDEL